MSCCKANWKPFLFEGYLLHIWKISAGVHLRSNNCVFCWSRTFSSNGSNNWNWCWIILIKESWLATLNSNKISLVINTGGGNQKHRISDARAIRRATLINKVPYCTNMSTAYAFLEAIKSLKTKKLSVKSLQEK